MNDEVIIPVKVEAEQGNVKQTLDKIRSYMEGLEKRRIDLINSKNLAVTKADIQAIDESLGKTEGIIANIKSQYAQINEYLAKASKYEDRTYGQAREASLRNQNSLQEQINKKTADLAKYQEIVTEADKRQAEEEQRILNSKLSEMQSVTAKMRKPKNELSQLNTALSNNQSAVEASMERQAEYSQQLFNLQKARIEIGEPTVSKDEKLLAQKVKVEKETQAQLLAEQKIIEENISKRQREYSLLQQERAAIQANAREEAKSTRYDNDYKDEIYNAETNIQSIQAEIATLEQRLAVEQEIYNTLNQEIAAGKSVEEVYNRVYKSAEARSLVEKGMLDDFERVTGEARKLSEETAQFEQENRDAENDLVRLDARYKGLIGQLRKLYDISKERVEMEREANEELGKSSKVASQVNSAWYKMTRSIKMLEHEIYSMNQNVNKLGSGFVKTSKFLAKTVLALSTGFLSLALNIKKATKAHKAMNAEFGNGIKTILKYGFGIRSLFVLFNRLRGGITDALKALAVASDYVNQEISSLITSLKFMEAAAATVVQPILKVLAPALEILSAAFEKAAYYASSFIATLTGQDFVFRAARSQVDYAKSLEKTGKAAKKARKELGYYDKLNVLHKDDKKGSGAGNDDMAGFDYKKSPLLEDAKKLAKKVQKFVKDFFKPLKKAWNRDGEYVIKKWRGALYSIKDLLADIGQDFIDVWQEEKTVKIFQNILKTLGHIGGFFKNLANSIKEAWDNNDIGKLTLEKIRDILLMVSKTVKKIAKGFEQWALDVDFYEAFKHFYDMLDALEKGPLKTVCELVEDFFNIVVYPFMTYMVEDGLPKLFDKIKEISEKIDWDKLRERMDKLFGAIEMFDEKLWDAFIIVLGDLGDKVAEIVNSDTFGKLIDWFVNWVEKTDAETMAKDIEKVATAILVLKGALVALKSVLGVVKVIGTFRTAFGNTGEALTQVTAVAETTAKAPWWSKIVANIGDVVKSMSALGGEGAGAATGGGVIGTVAGALSLIAGLFMNLFGVVKQADGEINILTVTLTALGTALGVIGAILLGAPALIAAVLGACIFVIEEKLVIIWNFVKNIATAPEEFAQSINKVLKDIGDWFNGIADWYDQIHQNVSDFFYNLGSNLGEWVGKIAGKIHRWIKNMPAKVGMWLEKSWPNILDTIHKFPENLAKWISEVDWAQFGEDILNGILWIFGAPGRFLLLVGEAIGTFISGFIDSFKAGFDIHSPSGVMKPYGKYILEGVLTGITDAVKNIGSWLKTNVADKIINGLKSAFNIVNGVAQSALDIGTNVVNGLKSGITEGAKNIADAGKELADKAINGTKNALGIHSPSKVFRQIGLYLDEGLAEGIDDGTKNVTNAVDKTTEKVAETADTPFALDNITSFADTFITTLTDMSTTAVSIISAMIDTINDKMSGLTTVDSLNSSLSKVANTKIPKIAQGFSAPTAVQIQNNRKDEFDWDKLSDIIRDVLDDVVEDLSGADNKEPVVLTLSGKQIAKVVWDETAKKYKQTGVSAFS